MKNSLRLRPTLVLMSEIVLLGLLLSACAAEAPQDPLEEIRELQASGQIEESIPKLIALIESGNREGEVLYRYGRARSLTGNPNRAVWALDAALADPEWLVRASHQLAFDAYRSHNFELALDILARLREEREDDPDEDIEALRLEARAYVQTRRHYDEALEVIDKLLEKDPDSDELIRLKAASLLGLKKSDEAYELIREFGIKASSIEEEPGDGDASASDATPVSVAEMDIGITDPSFSPDRAPDLSPDLSPDVSSNQTADQTADQTAGQTAGEGALPSLSEAEEGLDLSLDTSDREEYWCTVRVSFKREAGEPDEARKIAEECLERYPASSSILSEAIKIYSRFGPFERIVEALETAVSEAPDNTDLRITLAQHYDALGRVDDAEQLLAKAAERAQAKAEEKPIRAAAYWVDLGSFRVDHGDVESGLEAFQKAVDLLGDRSPPTLLFRQAEAMILAERYDEALEIAEATPIEVHGPMIRGRVAFERMDFETARDELSKAALLWPNNAAIRYYLARTAEGLGDFELAIEEYRQSMRSDPKLSAPRERLAKLHLAESRVRQASTILSFATPKEKPGAASTEQRLLWLEIDARLGRETDLNIPPDPNRSPDEMRLAMVKAIGRGLRKRPDAENAADILANIEGQISVGVRSPFVRERVAILVSQGRAEEALEAARAAAKVLPDDVHLRIAIAQALAAEGSQLDKASQAIERVLEAAPEEVDALKIAASIDRRTGKPERAASRLEKALEIDPSDWEALSARVDMLVEAGETEEASKRLEAYLAHDGPYEGRAALALAEELGDDSSLRARRADLARRALRFGAGPEALRLLEELSLQDA